MGIGYVSSCLIANQDKAKEIPDYSYNVIGSIIGPIGDEGDVCSSKLF